mgnify:CR=1 FL=1
MKNTAISDSDMRRLLSDVEKPSRYTGGELNSITKDFDQTLINFAFCFPDTYEVGMSNLGMRILYDIINKRQDSWCQRCFMPWPDMMRALSAQGVPLFSIEGRMPLAGFDMLGFTLQYELSYTNILAMLDMSVIPRHAGDRDASHPVVIAGGSCGFNAEPVAPFLDMVLLGDGEEVIGELLDLYREYKVNEKPRQWLFEKAAGIPGIYVPSLYDADYSRGCRVYPVAPAAPAEVEKRTVLDMDNAAWPDQPLVPNLEVVHDRVTLEIFRGCTRGCRFCQAGILYRPLREKSVGTLVNQAVSNLAATGYEELSLSSLSSGDYSCLDQLAVELWDKLKDSHASISLPSLRVDSYAQEYMKLMSTGRKAGLTLAPEAGTQRLRDVINKNITAEDLRLSVRNAYENGWDMVKLYFMIGLPTETYEDLDGIAELAEMVLDEYYALPKEKRARRPRVTVSTSNFVPKAHTPFQWCGQDDIQTLKEKQAYLREKLRPIRGVVYNYHDAETSHLEAVFARGDRRLAPVLAAAADAGAVLSGWSEHFDYSVYEKALRDCGIDSAQYANRLIPDDEHLAWEHLSSGVSVEFLQKEYRRALAGQTTPDCRLGCRGCGIQNCPGRGNA